MTRIEMPLSRKSALAIYSNHRLDSTYDGRYILRLPDLTLVYSDQYERKLQEYENRRSQQASETTERPRALGAY